MNWINYKWCTLDDEASLEKLVALFVDNIGTEYISHGEVIDGRANNLNEWKENIREIMREEFAEAMQTDFDHPETFNKLAMAQQNNDIIAVALVEFHPNTKVCILCDIVVDKLLRGEKNGETMLNWIETQIKLWGAKFLFLESGENNHSAHKFFKRVGFQSSSVVMVKEIG